MSWQTNTSKVVYENKWMEVCEDHITTPEGKDGLYGYVSSKSGTVFVIPVDDEGYTYIIKQEHYPGRRTCWQFIGGRSDGQPPAVAAKRELLEETGLEAASITIIGEVHSAMGLSTFKGTYCLAQDLTAISHETDRGEGILEMKRITLDEARKMILSGDISSAESIALYFLATAYLEEKGKSL
ncbi:MAG TPA: NUDIX hydrolase [Candidatus Saccharimonadales bacterium]|nr:NUDIX hydrolase [Candidatus Saccharimonadales bacterium]